MFNDTSSPLRLLQTRRSGKPRHMVAPGPSGETLDEIIATATRTPDHGKLFPWRFVIIEAEQRTAFAALLRGAYLSDHPNAGRLELEAVDQFAHQAPSLVVVLSSPRHKTAIPRWEQELSAGAVCMNLLHTAHAKGFVGCWLTGWATYSDEVRDAFGSPHDRIAGFLFMGTPGQELEERPRPDFDKIVQRWDPLG